MFRLTRSAIAIRVATVGLVVVASGGVAMAASRGLIVALSCAAVLTGVVAAFAPRTPWAAVCLGLLASAYAVADSPSTGTLVEIAGAVGVAAALWVIHSGYALAATVPAGAHVESSVIVQWIRRVGVVLVISLPVAAAAVWLGRQAPASVWLRVLGVAALLLVAAAPLSLASRIQRTQPSRES
jgi:hypothetical protein